MPQSRLDSASPPVPARRLTPTQKVGRCVAVASLVLPFLAFAGLVAAMAMTGGDPPVAARVACVGSLGASCLLGVAGLVGIPWWGERGVWVPSTLGIAISVSWYLLGRYGPG